MNLFLFYFLRLKNGELFKVNLFSKNHIPKRNVLLDDDDDVGDDENPSLYIGKHNNQLYIQESVQISRDTDSALHEYSINSAGSEIAYPRYLGQHMYICFNDHFKESFKTRLCSELVI